MSARKLRPGMVIREKPIRRGDLPRHSLITSVGAGGVAVMRPAVEHSMWRPIWPLLRAMRGGWAEIVSVPCGPCGAPLTDYDAARMLLRCRKCGVPHSAAMWSILALIRRGES